MSFTTATTRANPFVLEIIETVQGVTSVGGADGLEQRVAALEAAVARLEAVVTAAAGAAGVVIGPDAATFTNGAGTGGYTVTVNGNLVVNGTITN